MKCLGFRRCLGILPNTVDLSLVLLPKKICVPQRNLREKSVFVPKATVLSILPKGSNLISECVKSLYSANLNSNM
jgi:hypothetical protein